MNDPVEFTRQIASAEHGRAGLLAARQARRVELPLRYLRQVAHLTTPASDLALATKAVEAGLAPAVRLFDKLQLSRTELAEAFDVPTSTVSALLDDATIRSPLVLIDGEDAQALRDDVVARGRENALRIFREAHWGTTLRFYRPSGLDLDYCVTDLTTVLLRAGKGLPPDDYPIDGVIWPKVEHPEEMTWLCELLTEVERALGLPEHRLRLQFLVESGCALAELPAIVKASLPRLCGIIFGISDYSADLGLTEIRNDHPTAEAARLALINQAGAVGVPAIDNMTIRYPVLDKALDLAANKRRVLERLRECYDDARHGIDLGMTGKWVGHPAQLFACLLAYRTALSAERIEAEVRSVEAYQAARAQEKGAMIIGGVMTDRANDRHSRALLRRAVAWGLLDVERGLRLGVISVEEAGTL